MTDLCGQGGDALHVVCRWNCGGFLRGSTCSCLAKGTRRKVTWCCKSTPLWPWFWAGVPKWNLLFFRGRGGGAMRRIMRMRMRIVYRVFFRCPFSGHPATSFYQNLPCFSFVLRIYQCTCNVRHAKIALFQHFAATPQKCRLHLGSFTSKM